MKRWIRRYGEEFEGDINRKCVDISYAIPIGRNIRESRYNDFLNYFGKFSPIGVVEVNGYAFIIDGRNRARANLDRGLTKMYAEVFQAIQKSWRKDYSIYQIIFWTKYQFQRQQKDNSLTL